jgi:hypothetical protein
MITTGGDILACTDNQETLKTVASEPVQLVFEPVAVRGQTTVGNIVQTFAFDGKAVLKTTDRVL